MNLANRQRPSGAVWEERRRRVWERDRGVCAGCGEYVPFDRKMHIDHIVPMSLGGDDSETNLWPMHERCNLAFNPPWSKREYAPIVAAFNATVHLPPRVRRRLLAGMLAQHREQEAAQEAARAKERSETIAWIEAHMIFGARSRRDLLDRAKVYGIHSNRVAAAAKALGIE